MPETTLSSQAEQASAKWISKPSQQIGILGYNGPPCIILTWTSTLCLSVRLTKLNLIFLFNYIKLVSWKLWRQKLRPSFFHGFPHFFDDLVWGGMGSARLKHPRYVTWWAYQETICGDPGSGTQSRQTEEKGRQLSTLVPQLLLLPIKGEKQRRI